VRLQSVLGSHSASMHSATGASNWIAEGQVGRGRGWGFEENGEKEGVGARNRGDGVQRMQRQSRKIGRLLTSQAVIDEEERRGEEADFDSSPWAVFCISKMAAHPQD